MCPLQTRLLSRESVSMGAFLQCLHDKGNKLSSVRKLSVFHLENYSITLQLPVGFMLILEITDSEDVSSFVK